MSSTFTCSVEVSVASEVAFDHFVDAELLVAWIGDYAVLDAQPGGAFTLDIEGIPVRGEYLVVDPPRRVVVSWGHAGSRSLPPGSTEVEISLAPTPAGGTRITVEHRNLPDEHAASHRVGWPMFMSRLQELVSPAD